MYILADVSPTNEEASNSKDSMSLICTVTYDRVHKLLTVEPDFSNQGYYRIFGTGMGYDYWITHVSQGPSEEEQKTITKILKQVLNYIYYWQFSLSS